MVREEVVGKAVVGDPVVGEAVGDSVVGEFVGASVVGEKVVGEAAARRAGRPVAHGDAAGRGWAHLLYVDPRPPACLPRDPCAAAGSRACFVRVGAEGGPPAL